MKRRHVISCALAISAAAFLLPTGPVSQAAAQSGYPDRPVRLIVGFPPGGTNDLTARVVATALSKHLGQQVIVENRGGQSGSLATQYVSQQPADGYTLLYGSSSVFSTNTVLFPNVGYDPLQDFTPITRVASVPNILMVTNSLPVSSVQELIQYAKENPGKLNYASTGSGTSVHLDGLALAKAANIDIVHVPYRSNAQLLTDLIAGDAVQIYFDNFPTGILQVREGRLKGLAVTSPERSAAASDLPTMAEAGLKDVGIPGWFSLVAPKGLPDDIRKTIHSAWVEARNDSELVKRFGELGVNIHLDDPADFAEIIKRRHAWAASFIKENNIKPE